MHAKISQQTKQELLGSLRERFGHGSKMEKIKIVDEFVAVAECQRKHAIRLLASDEPVRSEPLVRGRRIYSEAVREVLIVLCFFELPSTNAVKNFSKMPITFKNLAKPFA